jgi:hypothetical protein
MNPYSYGGLIMPDENYVKDQAPDLDEGGKQTPIDPSTRAAVGDMKTSGRETAMPESQPGSTNIAAKDVPEDED